MRTLPGQSCPNFSGASWQALASSVCILTTNILCCRFTHRLSQPTISTFSPSMARSTILKSRSFVPRNFFRCRREAVTLLKKRMSTKVEKLDSSKYDCYVILRIMDLADALKRGLYCTPSGLPTNYEYLKKASNNKCGLYTLLGRDVSQSGNWCVVRKRDNEIMLRPIIVSGTEKLIFDILVYSKTSKAENVYKATLPFAKVLGRSSAIPP